MATSAGIPVEFAFLPGEANDVRGLNALPLLLPISAQVYADAAFTDYQAEDALLEADSVVLQVVRKRNSTRLGSPTLVYIEQTTRHPVETVFSQITLCFPKSIHAVTLDGFLLKLVTVIFARTLETAFVA